MIAKIFTNDEKIFFKILVEDDIEGKVKVYKETGGGLGCIIMDTKNNLGITKDAVKTLKEMIDRADRSDDDLNVLDWWKSSNDKCYMSWLCGNIVAVDKDIILEIHKDMKFMENEFILIDE